MASGKNITDEPIEENAQATNNQQNLDNFNEEQRKLAEDRAKLASLKEQCPIKNSDLVNYDTSKDRCTLKECPNGFVKSADGTKCEMYIDDIDIYRYKKENSCGEQYIDWITIPNYHLGNSFFTLNTGESKDDFNGCFNPCDVDFVPYKTKDDKDASKSKDSIHCIRKSIIDIGRYGKYTLDYCPLVLILLLSCDILENNEFRGEYVREKTNKKIEPSISPEIKDNELLLSEMKDELKVKGKKYIIHLLNKYKPDFLEKIKLVSFELDKCYDTSILNLSSDNKEPILHAYKVYNDSIDETNDLDKYVNAYKYMSNDGDVVQLMELHKKVLKWACNVVFDKNTNYGKRNLFLYEKFSNPEETDSSIDEELEYIRKVNKNEIKNEDDIFFNFDFLHPGKVLLKLMYSGDTDDIMKNSYILGLPATIILLSVFVILVVIAVLFYKYTKPIYARFKEVFVLVVYSIASIFHSSIEPKYIITDLLTNLKAQLAKQSTNDAIVKNDNTVGDKEVKNVDDAKGIDDVKKEVKGDKDVDDAKEDKNDKDVDGAKDDKEDKGIDDAKEEAKQVLGDNAKDLLGDNAKDLLGDNAKQVLGDTAKDLLGDNAKQVLGDNAKQVLGDTAKDLLGDNAKQVLGDTAKQVLGDNAKQVLGDKAKQVLGDNAKQVLGDTAKDLLGDNAKQVLGDTALGKLGDMAKGFFKKK